MMHVLKDANDLDFDARDAAREKITKILYWLRVLYEMSKMKTTQLKTKSWLNIISLWLKQDCLVRGIAFTDGTRKVWQSRFCAQICPGLSVWAVIFKEIIWVWRDLELTLFRFPWGAELDSTALWRTQSPDATCTCCADSSWYCNECIWCMCRNELC